MLVALSQIHLVLLDEPREAARVARHGAWARPGAARGCAGRVSERVGCRAGRRVAPEHAGLVAALAAATAALDEGFDLSAAAAAGAPACSYVADAPLATPAPPVSRADGPLVYMYEGALGWLLLDGAAAASCGRPSPCEYHHRRAIKQAG